MQLFAHLECNALISSVIARTDTYIPYAPFKSDPNPQAINKSAAPSTSTAELSMLFTHL